MHTARSFSRRFALARRIYERGKWTARVIGAPAFQRRIEQPCVPVARESTPTFLNIFRETRRRDYISNRFTINFEGGEELHDYRLALNVREVGFKWPIWKFDFKFYVHYRFFRSFKSGIEKVRMCNFFFYLRKLFCALYIKLTVSCAILSCERTFIS